MIRVEEERANKVRNYQLQSELHLHRVGPLRRHTRETLLSYMFLRNLPYLAVEVEHSKPLSPSSKKNIRRMCKKYGDVTMDVDEWMNGKNLRRVSDESSGGLNPPRATKHAPVAQMRRASAP